MTILYDGMTVVSLGGVPGHGNILQTNTDSAHVKWATGSRAGQTTLEDLYDLQPVTAVSNEEDDPMHLTAVARAYNTSGERGVLNFLASNEYLEGWEKIAADVLEYTQQRIRTDASMDLVEEQLPPNELRKVVQAAALALLNDAFGIEEE